MAREKEARFIKLWLIDILGFAKSFSITVDELEGVLSEGMGFDGSSIQGFARVDESDMLDRGLIPQPLHCSHGDPKMVLGLPKCFLTSMKRYALPGSLYGAIETAENSKLARDALGEHVFEKLNENKKIE